MRLGERKKKEKNTTQNRVDNEKKKEKIWNGKRTGKYFEANKLFNN